MQWARQGLDDLIRLMLRVPEGGVYLAGEQIEQGTDSGEKAFIQIVDQYKGYLNISTRPGSLPGLYCPY